MTKRVSIINFKGGVGKTVLALHLGCGLSYYHDKRVLLVDVDHQSSLSFTILEPKEWERVVEEGKTIDAVFQHFVKTNTKLPGKEIIYKKPYSADYPKLDLVPATLQLDETEIDLSSTSVGNPIESEWNKRTLICDWIEQNKIDEDYDYIIFDCPPATKLVTQNAIATSHGYIIPVVPDAVSTRGIPHLIERMFKKIDKKFSGLAEYLTAKGEKIVSTYVPDTKMVGIVVTKIKTSGPSYTGYTNDHYTHLSNIKNLYPNDVIEPYIVDGVGVPECMSRGYPVYDFADNYNVKNRNFIGLFEKVTNELKKRIDKL
jgi:chromosome partitioning protein